MKSRRILISVTIVLSILMATFSVAQAVPPLPSSFHGTVKVHGENVEEGTVISAWINGVKYAETASLMYEGDSVFAIDVPGDDTSTVDVIEGGVDHDTIVFKIGDLEAFETGLWIKGTYVELNLSVEYITVTADPQTKVYGDDDPEELTFTYEPDDPPITFTGALSRDAGEDVGTYAITLGDLAATGYTIVFESANFTITPKAVTVAADTKTKVYGSADPALTYTVDPALVPGDSFTGDMGRVSGENVGEYAIFQGLLAIDDGNGGANYALTFVSANLTITQRDITIGADDKEKIIGDPDPALTYSILSGSLAYDDVITGDLVRDTGETLGTYPIRIGSLAIDDGNGGANYNLSFDEGILTIKQVPLTITANPASKVYGDSDPVITYTSSVPSVPLTGALSREAGEDVDTYAITIGTLSAGDQYAISLVSADFTITPKDASVTPDAASKTYGDADPTFTGNLEGFLVGDGVSAAYSRVAGETVAGGPYVISAVLSPVEVLTNYNITYNTAAFTITKKAASVTPDAASKTYGDADPTFTGVLTGFLPADGVSATYSRTAGETVAGSPYTISAVLSPAGVLGNYDITYTTAAFTITKKAASVTPNAASKIYGADDPVLTGVLTGFLAGDGVSATYSRVAGESVVSGPYLISAVLSSTDVLANYDVTYNTAYFTINPKPITITADAKSKVYGLPDPAFTYVVTGLEDSDSVVGGMARLPGENVATYAITIGTLTAGPNYSITFVSADLTITKRPITITADDKEKAIGDDDPELTYTITTGSLAYDNAITGDLVRDAGEALGTYPIKVGSLAIDDGNGGANYDLTFVQGTFTIKQITLTVTAQAKTKVYGTADPVFTYTVSDPLVPLTGSLSRVAGENVGTYAITIGTLSAGPDYAITLVSADLTISPRPITITADDKEKVEEDPDPELTYQITSGSLAFDDDIVGELSRVPGEDVDTYDILIGTLAIDDSNGGANYELTFVKGTLTIVTGTFYIFMPLVRR